MLNGYEGTLIYSNQRESILYTALICDVFLLLCEAGGVFINVSINIPGFVRDMKPGVLYYGTEVTDCFDAR